MEPGSLDVGNSEKCECMIACVCVSWGNRKIAAKLRYARQVDEIIAHAMPFICFKLGITEIKLVVVLLIQVSQKLPKV